MTRKYDGRGSGFSSKAMSAGLGTGEPLASKHTAQGLERWRAGIFNRPIHPYPIPLRPSPIAHRQKRNQASLSTSAGTITPRACVVAPNYRCSRAVWGVAKSVTWAAQHREQPGSVRTHWLTSVVRSSLLTYLSASFRSCPKVAARILDFQPMRVEPWKPGA